MRCRIRRRGWCGLGSRDFGVDIVLFGRFGSRQNGLTIYSEIVPRGRQHSQQRGIIRHLSSKRQSKRISILFGTVRSWDDVMEAAVENDLHATIHFSASNDARVNLFGDARVDSSLQLLSRKKAKLQCQLTAHQPRHECHGTRGIWFVQTRLLS